MAPRRPVEGWLIFLIFKKSFMLQDHQLHHCENEHVQSASPSEPTQQELKGTFARTIKLLEHHRKLHVQRAVDLLCVHTLTWPHQSVEDQSYSELRHKMLTTTARLP